MFISTGLLIFLCCMVLAIMWLVYDLGVTVGHGEGYALAQEEATNDNFIKAKEAYFYPNERNE